MCLGKFAEFAGDSGLAGRIIQIGKYLAPDVERMRSDGFFSHFYDFTSLPRWRFCSWVSEAYGMMRL